MSAIFTPQFSISAGRGRIYYKETSSKTLNLCLHTRDLSPLNRAAVIIITS